MASGAVVRHPGKTDNFLSETDRQLLPLFPIHTQRGIAARPRQLVRENSRQNKPNPIGNTGVMLSADGAILKAHLRRGHHPGGLWFFAEKLLPTEHRACHY